MELLVPLLLACSLLFFPVATATTAKDACDSQTDGFQHLNSTGLHLTLHHPLSPCSPAPLPSNLPFSAIIAHDVARIARLTDKTPSSRLTTLHRDNDLANSLAATVPLNYGGFVGQSNYVTRLGLGTPATLHTMVVDTGSSFTWLQCAPCVGSCHPQTGPLYDPKASSTYASVPCSAPQCAELKAATGNPSNCSNSNVCNYHASYGDKSFSFGYLSKDTVSFSSSSFPGFYYGCGQQNGAIRGDRSAGIIGLARNKLSLYSQLTPALGSIFSYCLPTSTSSSPGYLSIRSSRTGKYSYTPMLSNSLDTSHYYVSFAGMSVGGSPLAVSPSNYSSKPTIMDSGTVITRLPRAVYTALSKAVAAAMGGTTRALGVEILDTCYKGQAANLNVPTVNMAYSPASR